MALREKGIHYGTHFTNMFMRNYPERITRKENARGKSNGGLRESTS